MTEEVNIILPPSNNGVDVAECDFYNEKICALFSKYFGFNVECENVFLSTIDCDIERECPIKRLEQENAKLKELLETRCYNEVEFENKKLKEALEEIREICSNTCDTNKDCVHSCYECKSIDEPVAINRILDKINEVLKDE